MRKRICKADRVKKGEVERVEAERKEPWLASNADESSLALPVTIETVMSSCQRKRAREKNTDRQKQEAEPRRERERKRVRAVE